MHLSLGTIEFGQNVDIFKLHNSKKYQCCGCQGRLYVIRRTDPCHLKKIGSFGWLDFFASVHSKGPVSSVAMNATPASNSSLLMDTEEVRIGSSCSISLFSKTLGCIFSG